jgi:hypothetical protein
MVMVFSIAESYSAKSPSSTEIASSFLFQFLCCTGPGVQQLQVRPVTKPSLCQFHQGLPGFCVFFAEFELVVSEFYFLSDILLANDWGLSGSVRHEIIVLLSAALTNRTQ